MAHAATHNGQCQLCGREQKLPNGRLSLHGYAVKWSEFIGTCPGSKHLPYEQSCNLIAEAIERVTHTITRLNDLAVEAAAETGFVWVHEYVKAVGTSRRHYTPSHYVWRKLPVAEVVVGYQTTWTGLDGKRASTHTYNSYTDDADFVRFFNGKRSEAFLRDAASHTSYLNWLNKRLAGWKLQDLKPV
jgi:hypothetical protein